MNISGKKRKAVNGNNSVFELQKVYDNSVFELQKLYLAKYEDKVAQAKDDFDEAVEGFGDSEAVEAASYQHHFSKFEELLANAKSDFKDSCKVLLGCKASDSATLTWESCKKLMAAVDSAFPAPSPPPRRASKPKLRTFAVQVERTVLGIYTIEAYSMDEAKQFSLYELQNGVYEYEHIKEWESLTGNVDEE